MRIAVVHSYYSSREPSGENVVVDLQVEALRRAGHDVTLVARRTDDLRTSKAWYVTSAARVADPNPVVTPQLTSAAISNGMSGSIFTNDV